MTEITSFNNLGACHHLVDIEMRASEIKKIRKVLKWSYRKFSEETGIHYNTIYRWEKGLYQPSHLAIRLMEQLKQSCIEKGLLKDK